MVDNTSYMFVTGPDVIKTVTHEDVTKEKLGGADDAQLHQRRGALHCARRRRMPAHDPRAAELPAAEQSRRSRRARATSDPVDREDAALDTIVPAESNLPYDIKDVIHRVVDDGEFFEVHEHWAQEHRGRLRAHGRADASASSRISRRFWPAAWTSIRR